jgi:quercetin dioxygenase-like cupin family protein
MKAEVRRWTETSPPEIAACVRVLVSEGLQTRLCVASDDTDAEAAHDHDEVVQVIAGEAALRTPPGTVHLNPGDRASIPAGTRHAIARRGHALWWIAGRPAKDGEARHEGIAPGPDSVLVRSPGHGQ